MKKSPAAILQMLVFSLGVLAGSSATQAAPKAPVAPPPPKPVSELEPWISLCSLRPSAELQGQLLGRQGEGEEASWHTRKIELGVGPLFLDQSSLLITKLPSVEGKALDAHGLLDYVRKHLGELIAPSAGGLAPAEDSDKKRWESDNPAGAVLALEMAGSSKTAALVAENSPDSFSFISVHAGMKGIEDSALIWQRRIAVGDATPFEGGCILSIRAVARAAAEGYTADQAQSALAEPVWKALLGGVADFVQKNGGTVESSLLPAVVTTASWEGVREKFHKPKIQWLDIDGNWVSTDPGHRFRIEIQGATGKCDFIERNSHNQELRMTLPVRTEREGNSTKFIISRPNNTKEVLNFYNFSIGVTDEIVAKDPKPSFIVLTRTGSKLSGLWSGLSITKDQSGKHVKEIKQPGEIKAKVYPFVSSTPDKDLVPGAAGGKGKPPLTPSATLAPPTSNGGTGPPSR